MDIKERVNADFSEFLEGGIFQLFNKATTEYENTKEYCAIGHITDDQASEYKKHGIESLPRIYKALVNMQFGGIEDLLLNIIKTDGRYMAETLPELGNDCDISLKLFHEKLSDKQYFENRCDEVFEVFGDEGVRTIIGSTVLLKAIENLEKFEAWVTPNSPQNQRTYKAGTYGDIDIFVAPTINYTELYFGVNNGNLGTLAYEDICDGFYLNGTDILLKSNFYIERGSVYKSFVKLDYIFPQPK